MLNTLWSMANIIKVTLWCMTCQSRNTYLHIIDGIALENYVVDELHSKHVILIMTSSFPANSYMINR